VRGLGRPGDVLLAISTSGRSKNVVAALRARRSGGEMDRRLARQSMQSLCDIA
jgi:D-sedoheptulose 7-phosphate isomerase